MSTTWQEHIARHTTTALEAVRSAVKSGDFLVFGHAVAAPGSLSKALYDDRERLTDVKAFHMLYFAEPWHLRPEMVGHVHPVLNFLDKNSRPAYLDKRVDYLPCHFHELPDFFRNGIYPVDVALISVSEPNEEGYCSFGVSCDYTKPAAEAARIVIAEINKQMPFIGGDNLIHVTKLDYIVPVDRPLVELPLAPIGPVEQRIGELCAELIYDGDTLQIGIGAIPDAVLQSLRERKDLGLHTEMFTDGVMHMINSGNVTGEKKTLHPRKVVSSIIMGTKALYDFVNKNDMIEMYPVDHTNDPYMVGQNDNMVSINSCLEIDLYGQVASEAIGLNQYSGTGGQVDYLRGAKRSRGGRSILAFTSTAKNGTCSRIVPVLPSGATVTSGRNEVDYIATEYGVVRLRGLTLRERALALTSIAHPDFRPGLMEVIRERFGE